MAHKVISRLDELSEIRGADVRVNASAIFVAVIALLIMLWAAYKKLTPMHVEETPTGKTAVYLDGSEARRIEKRD